MILSKKQNEYNAVFQFPDQFVSRKEKEGKEWQAENMDYFSNIAWYQWSHNKDVRKNYRLKAGVFDFADYSSTANNPIKNNPIREILDEYEETKDFSHLKHYPIINPPLYTMIGELSNRVFKPRVKAMDDNSNSIVEEYRTQEIAKAVLQALQQQPDITEDEIRQQLDQKLKSFSTVAEEWGNKFIQVCIHQFDMKRKSAEGFDDFLTCDREFHHMYEDTSKLGFTYRLENPSNIWHLSHPNALTTDDSHAIGTIERLHISEILSRWKLDEEEIKHLLSKSIQMLQTTNKDGLSQYTTTSPAHPDVFSPPYDEVTLIDRELLDYMGYFAYDTKQNYKVVTAYWQSKVKIGKVVYLDEKGYQNTRVVSEDYIFSDEDGDISIEWTWKNIWYKGTKIDTDIYINVEPITFTDKCPIIGRLKSNKNAKATSMLDLMKPYQEMYNISANQLYEILNKDIGVVFLGDIRVVPNKDSDNPIEQMLWQAKESGVIFIDTSLENTGGQIQFNQMARVDLSRSAEIMTRIQLMQALKEICWELIGISRQRTGSTTATETATGVNTALSQSYAQTEPYFKAHEEIMRKVMQRMLDIGQYVAIKKPESTINYLSTDLDNIYFKIKRDDLSADLFLFTTDLSEDREIQQTLKELARFALQNGTELVDVADMLTTNADKKIHAVLDNIKKEKQKMMQQQQELEQQQIQLQQQQIEEAKAEREQARQDSLYINEQANQTKLEVAAIQALGFDRDEKTDNSLEINTLLDSALSLNKLAAEQRNKTRELDIKQQEVEVKKKALTMKPKTPKK